MSGALNPNSVTNARVAFLRRCRRLLHGQLLAVMLGEVDLGFLLWRRYSEADWGQAVEELVDRYMQFVEELALLAGRQVFVLSPPMPFLEDYSKGRVHELRGEVDVSLEVRMSASLRFCKLLEHRCREMKGAVYVDSASLQLDGNGRVEVGLLPTVAGEHHMEQAGFRRVVLAALEDSLQR